MKRILLLLLLTVISLNCALPANADKEEYLQFMGIPIEGSVSSFVRKLQSKCFKLDTYVDNNVLLSGTFAGYSNCIVYVCGDKDKQMSHVYVTFPVQTNWTELEQRYNTLKSNLTEKYGTPTSIEECKNPNATDKMAQLSNGEINYRSEFVVVDKKNVESSKDKLISIYNSVCPNGELDTAKVKSMMRNMMEKSAGMSMEKYEKLPADEKNDVTVKIISDFFRNVADLFDATTGEVLGNITLTIMNNSNFGDGKITILYQDEKQKQRIHKENIKDL